MDPQISLGNFTLKLLRSLIIIWSPPEQQTSTWMNLQDKTANNTSSLELKGSSKDTNLPFVKCQTGRVNFLPSDVGYTSFWGLKNHNRLCFKDYFHAYLSIIGQGANKFKRILMILF